MKVELTHQRETSGRGCWLVDILSDDPEIGSVHSAHFTSRSHAGAYRKGAQAAFDGKRENPYQSERGLRGLGILGRRRFRNAWAEGFAAAQCWIRY